MRRLTRLWTVLVFVVSALTGTTAASASASTYDTPTGARVDVHENEGAVARPPAFSGVPEWSAPPPVEAGGATTTPDPRFIATNTADDVLRLGTSESWGNANSLARHFRDHGADFAASSADD